MSHPEDTCDDCGLPNVPAWHAPSPLWNQVVRPGGQLQADPMLCPRCFMLRAQAAGMHGTWVVDAERISPPLHSIGYGLGLQGTTLELPPPWGEGTR